MARMHVVTVYQFADPTDKEMMYPLPIARPHGITQYAVRSASEITIARPRATCMIQICIDLNRDNVAIFNLDKCLLRKCVMRNA